jgi:hypothetical protein
MADVSGKFFSAKKVRTGVSPSSPGIEVGETLPPVNPPGGALNSVGLTMPSAFTVSNSPLTANGTIGVAGAGTTAEYIRGDGSLETFPSLTGYVPYTGATQNVDLGEFGLDAGFVNLDTTPTGTPTTQGTIFWDADDETVDIILNGYTMKIGEDLFYPVKNQTGSTIAKGTAVRFNGTVGASGRLLIAPFIADGSVPSTRFMGVTAEEILNGEDGKVLYFGRVRGINTNAFNEGDILYASTTVAGGFQTAIPVAPNNIVQVAAVVTKSATVGTIFVRPTLGSNINKDEGVKIVSVADKNLLQYQSGTGLWENKTLGQVLGGTSSQFVKGDGSLDSTTYQNTADKGQPNGYASLDSNGKVPLVQINDALIGNVNFQGLWNAATNTPTLVDPPSSGTKGYYYIVSTGGTFAGITFEVGDWIISNGTAWGKVDNTDAVSSVFGRTGNVVAANGDYTTAQVTESGNLYYTEARVNANTNVAANTAARHNAVTLGTANGLSLSTQQLSLGLASAGVTGALSGTDWSTFNSKQQALNGTGFVKISGTTISYDNSTYLTTAAAASTYLPLAGGTMTGNINWTANDVGLTWSRNTDGAFIKFISVGDGTGESYLQIGTSDNGNEAIVFTQSSLIRVQVDTDGLLKNGSSQKYVYENGATWGIAISGNAATVTNGVVTTGSYSNPSWITALSWTKITDRPTTLAGYGITDAVPSSRTITINGTAQDLSANRTFNVGTVTSVGLSSATSGVTIGSTPVTSSGTITLAIATASGSQNGLLSSTDWTTFNNKQNALTNPVTGTGTTNYLPKFTGTSTIGNSLFQETTNAIGLGVTPSAWGGGFSSAFQMINGSGLSVYTGGPEPIINLAAGAFWDSTNNWRYFNTGNATGLYSIDRNSHKWSVAPSGTAGNAISFTQAMTLFSDGNLLLTSGTVTNAGFKLDVNGTGRFSSSLTVSNNFAIGGTITSLSDTDELSIFAGTTIVDNRARIELYGPSHATLANQTFVRGTQIVFTSSAAATEYMRITSGGNVLIGTATDTGNIRLQVAPSASSWISQTIAGTGGTDKVVIGNYNGLAAIGAHNSALNAWANLAINFGGGNVLIGTTTDSDGRLRVKASGNDTYAIAFERSNATTTIGGFYQNSGSSGEMILRASNGSTNVKISSTGDSYWAAPSAKFSIGTSINTTDLLRVNGNTFTNTIRTFNPENDNRSVEWRLGSASIATITPNRRLRVSVDGIEYYIAAVEI